MKVETVKCDVCGRVKGEANKWLALRENDRTQSVLIGRFEDFDDLGSRGYLF